MGFASSFDTTIGPELPYLGPVQDSFSGSLRSARDCLVPSAFASFRSTTFAFCMIQLRLAALGAVNHADQFSQLACNKVSHCVLQPTFIASQTFCTDLVSKAARAARAYCTPENQWSGLPCARHDDIVN